MASQNTQQGRGSDSSSDTRQDSGRSSQSQQGQGRDDQGQFAGKNDTEQNR